MCVDPSGAQHVMFDAFVDQKGTPSPMSDVTELVSVAVAGRFSISMCRGSSSGEELSMYDIFVAEVRSEYV